MYNLAHLEDSLLLQLSINSVPYHDPLNKLNWHELSLADFWLPTSAISLHHVPEFAALPIHVKKLLSQYEFLNFLEGGIWLESIFLERISKKLRKLNTEAEYAYCLHEIREEAGHSLMFLKVMEHSGLSLPKARFFRPGFADLLGRHAPADSGLFWLAVLLGEEIPDRLNRYIRLSEDERLNPVIKQLCTLHIIDEARHIAHAKNVLQAYMTHAGRLKKRLLSYVISHALNQFIEIFYFPGAAIYESAGLTPGKKWQELARNNFRRNFVVECMNPTLRFLAQLGIRITLKT